MSCGRFGLRGICGGWATHVPATVVGPLAQNWLRADTGEVLAVRSGSAMVRAAA